MKTTALRRPQGSLSDIFCTAKRPPSHWHCASKSTRYSLRASKCPASANHCLTHSWQEHVGRKYPPKSRHLMKGAKRDLKIPVCAPGPGPTLEKAQERAHTLDHT